MLGTARAAFTRAFELTAAISAAVSLVTAIGVMVLLRRVRGGSESKESAGAEPGEGWPESPAAAK